MEMKNIKKLIVVDELYVGVDIQDGGYKFIHVDFCDHLIRMNKEDAYKLAHTIIYLIESEINR